MVRNYSKILDSNAIIYDYYYLKYYNFDIYAQICLFLVHMYKFGLVQDRISFWFCPLGLVKGNGYGATTLSNMSLGMTIKPSNLQWFPKGNQNLKACMAPHGTKGQSNLQGESQRGRLKDLSCEATARAFIRASIAHFETATFDPTKWHVDHLATTTGGICSIFCRSCSFVVKQGDRQYIVAAKEIILPLITV